MNVVTPGRRAFRVWLAAVGAAAACCCLGAGMARAQVPAGMPTDVPAAATDAAPTLPEPSITAWPFPNTFPQTSGTGRLEGGASLWSDYIYDDYGASSQEGLPTSSYDQSSSLAARQGDYVFPAGAAENNGADIFRAGVGLHGNYSYWRVDWVTLADPSVPIAEWTFDTDNNTGTGASAWPADADVSSPGIDQALVVSSRGAWLVNPTTGIRTDVLSHGGKLTVDRNTKSFIVAVPRTLMPVSGGWRVRLAAGLADATGQNFAAPDIDSTSSSGTSTTAERVYNVTFRNVAQEPPVYTDGTSDAQIALAQKELAGTPIGEELGVDGIARSITGNYWMEDDQADTLAGGDVSKFSLLVSWPALATQKATPAPQPTGYSARWYVSRLNLGGGVVTDDGGTGNFKPTLLERVQPYAVYVPSTYKPGQALPLTWILHSLEVNYNQYGALDPQLLQELCQDRNSICATTEGFGPAGWYYNEAETDFWQVWRQLAQAFALDPQRTVISGYSMGGWASYKLAFEHPDDFAGALVLDGPLACGIEAYPGLTGYTSSGPACSDDGQSQPFVANARWVPYTIDQTDGDELVPTTGVVAQAQAFDSLGERYHLFIHTGGDHLAFAVEDRFADVVTALGNPVRTVNPGAFTYDWYPSLSNATFGIGATGDYWVGSLRARNSAFGVVASVVANDAALPDPAVTVQHIGPALSPQPLPGTNYGLTWQLGARPAAQPRMTLHLTDVAGLSVDASAAKLETGTITVLSDGSTQLSVTNLVRGTEVLEAGRVVSTAGADGVASVGVGSGSTVLTLFLPADRTPPVASIRAPQLASDAGTGPRFAVRWSGADRSGSGLDYYTVQVKKSSFNKGDRTYSYHWQTLRGLHATRRHSVMFGGHDGQTYEFRVRAVDHDKNVGSWANATTVTLTGVHIAGGHYHGRWRVRRVTGAYDGRVVSCSSTRCRFGLNYNGGAIWLVGDTGPKGGRVRIVLDGRTTVVNLRNRRAHARRVLFAGRVKPGNHRLSIQVRGGGVVALEGLAITSRHR